MDMNRQDFIDLLIATEWIYVKDLQCLLESLGLEVADNTNYHIARAVKVFSPESYQLRKIPVIREDGVISRFNKTYINLSNPYVINFLMRYYDRVPRTEIEMPNGVSYRNDLMGMECSHANYWGTNNEEA